MSLGENEVAQSCSTLPDPMDCGLPGSSAHGSFRARGLEWGCHCLLRRSGLHAARSHPYILPWGPWQSVKSHVTGETLLGHVLFSSPLAQETSHCNPTCHPGWSCPSLPAILAILASCHPGWSCPLIPVVSLWPWPVFL